MHKKFCAHCGSRKVASDLMRRDYTQQKQAIKNILSEHLEKLGDDLYELKIMQGHTGIREAVEVLLSGIYGTVEELLPDVIKTMEDVETGRITDKDYSKFPSDRVKYNDYSHSGDNRAKADEILNSKFPQQENERLKDKIKSLDTDAGKRLNWEYRKRKN